MSTITFDHINESQAEVNSLRDILHVSRSLLRITLHVILIVGTAHNAKNALLKAIGESDDYLDEDGHLVEKLEQIQQGIKKIHQEISELNLDGIMMKFNKLMLKNAFNDFGVIITNINEHDADIDISSGNVSGPFNNVNDIISHLHS